MRASRRRAADRSRGASRSDEVADDSAPVRQSTEDRVARVVIGIVNAQAPDDSRSGRVIVRVQQVRLGPALVLIDFLQKSETAVVDPIEALEPLLQSHELRR